MEDRLLRRGAGPVASQAPAALCARATSSRTLLGLHAGRQLVAYIGDILGQWKRKWKLLYYRGYIGYYIGILEKNMEKVDCLQRLAFSKD